MLNGVRNDNPPNRRITFEAGNVSDISWSTNLDLLFRPGKHIDFTLSTSRAFRSPGLEERFKYIDLLSTVRIGDPNLKPESGWFTDLGIRLWYDKLQVNQNFFINSMNNLIVEVPGLFIYNYTANPGNYDTIPALINDNVDKALLYGFDFSGNYNVFDGISVTAAFSFIRGLDTGKDINLPLMPPINGSLGISYEHSGYFGISTVCTLSAAQKMIASGETATPGYALYDLQLYSKPVDIGFAKLSLFTGVENLGNRAWLNHLSTNRGIIKYEPGRNFYVKLKIDF
jgi:hemoglobin/transferrin/lactoferrin receptor protein